MGLKIILIMFPLPVKGDAGPIDVAANLYSPLLWVRLFSAVNIGGEFEDSWSTPSGKVSTPVRVSMFVASRMAGFQLRVTSNP
jgi:hypothetical protein